MELELIQFSKIQTYVARRYLIEIIGTLATSEGLPDDIVGKLSIILAVMNKCYEVAPDIPNLSPEMAEWNEPNNH